MFCLDESLRPVAEIFFITRTFNTTEMDNPRPKAVFFADIGRRDNSKYCEVGNWYVVEAEVYDSIQISAIRIWKPVMSAPTADFNPHIVSDWEVQKEEWYNDDFELMTKFENVCECKEKLLEFTSAS